MKSKKIIVSMELYVMEPAITLKENAVVARGIREQTGAVLTATVQAMRIVLLITVLKSAVIKYVTPAKRAVHARLTATALPENFAVPETA